VKSVDDCIFPFFIRYLWLFKGSGQVCCAGFADVEQLGLNDAACGQVQLVQNSIPSVVHSVIGCSSLQGLFQHMQLLVEFRQLLTLGSNLTHGV
jgi:hypothetical protein